MGRSSTVRYRLGVNFILQTRAIFKLRIKSFFTICKIGHINFTI